MDNVEFRYLKETEITPLHFSDVSENILCLSEP